MKSGMTVGPVVSREFLETLAAGEDLERACQAEREGRDPLEFLLAERRIEPLPLLVALARWFHCPFVSLRRYRVEESAIALVTHDVARRLLVMPLFRLDDRFYLAMADPSDLPAQDFLRRMTGLSIHPVVALRDDLEDALRRHYLGRAQAGEAIGAISARQPQAAAAAQPMAVEDEDAPVVQLVQYIFSHAIHLGASDIHLEPFHGELAMRYRIDGILHEFEPPPVHLYRSLVSRVKILASLDISERRLPQDGRLTFEVSNKSYDLRVSIMPGVHGENIVVRILDSVATRHQLEDLGFSERMLQHYQRLITRPYGMILVTGPTGSGKTTTLYTTIKRIYTPRRKFVTLEDPVECHLRGVNQFQIHPSIGFTFAQGLRAALRHDPDVIMLGEIRDPESAEIALRSSLTGHLLFSTLHTNNAPLAVTRLVDMGVPAFLVLSSLIGVMAQRLLRRLCADCKAPLRPTSEEWLSVGVSRPIDTPVYGPVGCAACNHLGYRGRVAIYELLEITPAIRSLGVDGYMPGRMRSAARTEDYVTLRDSAVEKLLAGTTSLEEVQTLMTSDD